MNSLLMRLLGRPGKAATASLATIDAYLVGQFISGAIKERKPFLATRLGWLESAILSQYKKSGSIDQAALEKLWRHAGVYPPTQNHFLAFSEVYLAALGAADLLALMHSPGESALIKEYANNPLFCDLSSLEPYFSAQPWSEHLKGLKVLVIHPFIDSIRYQYENARQMVFANPLVLPEFELTALRAPQTIAGNAGDFTSWSRALLDLKEQVRAKEFDIAIVGCGAYGLPIGAFIKERGKACIHLGGATQIFFGISGARWREQPAFRALQTSAWISPLESERPPNWQQVEGGCYW